MLRFLTLGAVSLATLLVSINSSSAQMGPGQLGPLWQRTAPGSDTYNYRYNQNTFQQQPATQAATESQSFYSGATNNRDVLLRLQVPADAKVWIDGTLTNSTGESRSYLSPPLNAGQNYSYQIRVQSGAGDQTRTVPVRSGDRINLDFRNAANQ
jgi:uncharacterized protein (TIGR03000 family)